MELAKRTEEKQPSVDTAMWVYVQIFFPSIPTVRHNLNHNLLNVIIILLIYSITVFVFFQNKINTIRTHIEDASSVICLFRHFSIKDILTEPKSDLANSNEQPAKRL